MMRRIKGWLLFLMLVVSSPLWAGQLSDIHVSNSGTQARITLSFVGEPNYTYSSPDKRKVALDIEQTGVMQGLPLVFSGSNLVKSIRAGQPKDDQSMQLVVDLTKNGVARAETRQNGANYTVVFTINADVPPPPPPVVAQVIAPAPAPVISQRVAPAVSAPATNARVTTTLPSNNTNPRITTAEPTQVSSGQRMMSDTRGSASTERITALTSSSGSAQGIAPATSLTTSSITAQRIAPATTSSVTAERLAPATSSASSGGIIRPNSRSADPASNPFSNSSQKERTTGTLNTSTTVRSAHKAVSSSADKVIIAIDAGHGGQDPGAIGPDGTQEKNVTIAIARKLRELLNDDPMFKGVLTRNGDYFISVMGRSDVARKQNANLLVSIHADAAPNRDATGASVWVLSNSRANSEMAGWLEQHEKQSELLGGAGDVLANSKADPYLSQAVLDLQFGHSQRVGYDVATNVLSELRLIGDIHKRRPEHASLGVLRSPDIPSLLVETGFISNEGEERLLGSDSYQQQVAGAIYKGLRRYFLAHPMQGMDGQKAAPQTVQNAVATGQVASN